MSTVGSAALLGSLVDLHMGDVQGLRVQVLKLGIALGVLEEAEKVLSALLWPSSLGHSEDSGLGSTANATSVSSERN